MNTWREQPIIVEGRRYALNDIHGGKLYHGSPRELDNHTILTAQPDNRNFSESPKNQVCFTSDFNTAVYWARKALNDMTAQVYVYEIEPGGQVIVHRSMPANYGKNVNLQEGRSVTAKIIGVIKVPSTR